jgi:hypothetical protein
MYGGRAERLWLIHRVRSRAFLDYKIRDGSVDYFQKVPIANPLRFGANGPL